MKFQGIIQDDFTIKLDKKTVAKLRKIAIPGIEIVGDIDLANGRSLPQHRRYFSILQKRVASFPEKTLKLFLNNLVNDFSAVGQIDYTMIHDLLKKIYGLDSISFAKLSQADANKFFNFADEKFKEWGV